MNKVLTEQQSSGSVMKWNDIDAAKLPDGEVLAANFRKGTYGYKEKLLGYLSYNSTEDMVECESNNEVLENCTHYIDLKNFDL